MTTLHNTPIVADRSLTLEVCGELVVLHPERALALPEHHTLVVADLHWGKATALRSLGVPVPAGGTSDDLRRLDTLLERTAPRRLLVLGDLAHSRHGWDHRALAPVQAWRARWPSLDITLVRGNHDARAGDPPADLCIHAMDAPLEIGALAAAHEPFAEWPAERRSAWDAGGLDRGSRGYLLCGHLHPTVLLRGRGRDRVRLPCFVVGAQQLVLPAFSTFTGGGAWEPAPDERAYAIADETVIAC